MTEEMRRFFAGYFHQDWDMMADDWQGIVDNFARDSGKHPSDKLRLLAQAIDEFRLSRSEAELLQALRKAHTSYAPQPPETNKEWLGQVAARLRQHAEAVENGTTL